MLTKRSAGFFYVQRFRNRGDQFIDASIDFFDAEVVEVAEDAEKEERFLRESTPS